MTFSICIPNYNYAQFLGLTIESVLGQHHGDLELHISDNASTDGSVDVVRSFDDDRVRLSENNCNVGFAGNLDRAVRGTTGEWIILLSSDDLMTPRALSTYRETLDNLGDDPGTIISATCQVIDGDGKPVGILGPPTWCWQKEDVDRDLSRAIGHIAYRLTPEQVLERSLRHMRNPLWFASTCYSRKLYDAVEGYRGQNLMSPDKEFHWRPVSAADSVIFIDSPLFEYRCTPRTRATSTRVRSSSWSTSTRCRSTPTRTCARPATPAPTTSPAASSARTSRSGRSSPWSAGDRLLARRTIAFGNAAYPQFMASDPLVLLARGLVAGRLITSPILRKFERPVRNRLLTQSMLVKEGNPGVPA